MDNHVEKEESSCTAGRNKNWCSHFRKQLGFIYQIWRYGSPVTQKFHSNCTYNRNVSTCISKDIRIFWATSFTKAETESHPDTAATYSRIGKQNKIKTWYRHINGMKMKDKKKFHINDIGWKNIVQKNRNSLIPFIPISKKKKDKAKLEYLRAHVLVVKLSKKGKEVI